MGSFNTTTVKYIHLKASANGSLHDVTDYELEQHVVTHRKYGELHYKVRASCPKGYTCIEPLALRHEVTWTTNGEADVLHHAIEECEYEALWAGERGPKTICVDVE